MATDCDVMHDKIIRSKSVQLRFEGRSRKDMKLHKHFSNLVFQRSGKQTQSNCNNFLTYLFNKVLQSCQPLLLLLLLLSSLYQKEIETLEGP